ncbi:MAG TPA: hypothetical protein VN665_03890 [Candidatus Paceibacterota bacterium]|nr:hypothetical protein [Candidatus Paceibacterota bacterium]
MKVKFTIHAQARIEERKIPASRVVEAIRNPSSTKSVYEGKIRARKKFGKKILEVVYFKDGFRDRKEEYLVVTAYYI